MCFAADAQPPIPEHPENLGPHEDLLLTSLDGAPVMAHRALPREASAAGVVILPDVRGLHDYYRALAQRFAEHGVAAIAIDYFGRTAGPGDRGADFDVAAHRASLDSTQVAADTAVAMADLREQGVAAVVTIGFCFGGSQSWRQSAAKAGPAAAIGLYGRPGMARDAVRDMKAPLLILAAGADEHIPQSEYQEFAAVLSDAGVENEMHSYPGAPHSFFDRTFADHAQACADAWSRVRSFIELHTGATLTP